MLTVGKFASSALEQEFFTFKTVNYDKNEKGRISGITKGRIFLRFFGSFVLSIARVFRK